MKKPNIRKLADTPLGPLCSVALRAVFHLQYRFLCLKWRMQGAALPNADDIALMKENVTFVLKSFERQHFAAALYRNIQRYYPGVRVIIADDSRTPFPLTDAHLEVLQLPFNSGVSYGFNRALARVETPFMIRLDDDHLLTPHARFHDQLRFLQAHPQVDLAAVYSLSAPKCRPFSRQSAAFCRQTMQDAPKPLKLPHLTPIDEHHIVVAKAPNCFIAHTDAIRRVGYDDRIRMIDHHEFFFRAAGELVSVLDTQAFVYHRHDVFDRHYNQFRGDYRGDQRYIAEKHMRPHRAADDTN